MKIEIHGLSLSLGYRGDWHSGVPDPTPERMRLLKEAIRLAARREFGWLDGPPCDLNAYQLVVANLAAAFNTGTGRLDEATLLQCVRQLIACKQPTLVEGSFDIAIDAADSLGLCVPNPKPPPYEWRDRHGFNLIKPNGKRASVTVTADGVTVKAKLVVSASWKVPEVAVS